MVPQEQVTGGLEFVATGGVNGESVFYNEEEIYVGCDWWKSQTEFHVQNKFHVDKKIRTRSEFHIVVAFVSSCALARDRRPCCRSGRPCDCKPQRQCRPGGTFEKAPANLEDLIG